MKRSKFNDSQILVAVKRVEAGTAFQIFAVPRYLARHL